MVVYQNRPYLLRLALSPFALKKQKRRVAMLHLGRSGSTVLANLFRHPRNFVDGEIIEHYLEHTLDWPWHVFECTARARLSPTIDLLYYLRQRLRLSYAENYINEFKPFQLRLCGSSVRKAVEFCHELGFEQFVLLQRRNLLRIIVSGLRAQKYKVWHARKEQQAMPVSIDLENVSHDRCVLPLVEMLEKLERDWVEIERFAPPGSTRIVYEDHIENDPMVAAELVSNATGLPYAKRPSLRRIAQGRLANEVVNWAEVETCLRGTRFAWMTEGD